MRLLERLTQAERECVALFVLALVALVTMMIADLGHWGLIVACACIGYIMAVCTYPFIRSDDDAIS